MVNNKHLPISVAFKALFSANGKGLKQTVGNSTRRIKSFAQKAKLKFDSEERRQLPYFLCHSLSKVSSRYPPTLTICLPAFFSLSSNQVELFSKRKHQLAPHGNYCSKFLSKLGANKNGKFPVLLMTNRAREITPGLGQVDSFPSARQLDFDAWGSLSWSSETVAVLKYDLFTQKM